MLTVNKYKDILKEEFYLDSDDITIRRKKDGWRNKYKANDKVIPYKLHSLGYGGIHIPKTRMSILHTHLLCFLRGAVIPDNCVIDHINGDIHNNLRSNLRIVPQAINCRNSKMSKNNTSGYTGISWNKSSNCYIVRKYLKGVRVYGGSATTLEDAKKILDNLNIQAAKDGYTTRHGK